jgi:hypothetical protein
MIRNLKKNVLLQIVCKLAITFLVCLFHWKCKHSNKNLTMPQIADKQTFQNNPHFPSCGHSVVATDHLTSMGISLLGKRMDCEKITATSQVLFPKDWVSLTKGVFTSSINITIQCKPFNTQITILEEWHGQH